ncbi:MAG: hypothetical protein WCX73_04375 [Candidatus Pacearchaeota archaeon]
MTPEEFVNCVVNLRTSACFMTDGDAKRLHDEVSEHLRSVIRGELKGFIRYGHNRNFAFSGSYDDVVDEFLNNNPVSNGDSGC